MEALDTTQKVLSSEELEALIALARQLGLTISDVELHTNPASAGRWVNIPHIHISGRSRRTHIAVPAGFCP